MPTTIFDFTTPSDYVLEDVSIVDDVASLSFEPNPGQLFSQPLTSSSGFTFNSALTAINAGVLSQIDQRPASATFFAAWTSSLSANWSGSGNGSLVVSAFNGAAINGGLLDLTGSVNKYVSFSATHNTDSLQIFSLEFQVTPNYSGAPVDDQVFLDIAPDETNSENNCVQIDHYTDGTLYVSVYDDTGTLITDSVFHSFSPTAGQTTTFLLQCDGNAGITTLFENGSQVSQQTGIPFTRSAPLVDTFVGKYHNGQDTNSNFKFSNFSFYSTVVTPASPSLSLTIYAADTVTFPPFTYPGLGSIVGFSGFSAPGVGEPGYILETRFWNGSAWVTSNGTFAQSNPASTVAANIAALPNNNTLNIKVITVGSNVSMTVTAPVTITYAGQIFGTGSIQSNTALIADQIQGFSSNFSETGSDTVSFALNVNGTLKYWNGSAWVNSNGQFAQTNTASVINTQCESLLGVSSLVQPYAFLKSASGSTSPNITTMTMNYSFGAINPSLPLTTIVYGFLCDLQSNPVMGANIIFSLINLIPNAYNAAGTNVLLASSVTVVTDSNGFFSVPLIATTQFQGTNTFMQVVIQKGTVIENVASDGSPLFLTIPIQGSIDITSLLSA